MTETSVEVLNQWYTVWEQRLLLKVIPPSMQSSNSVLSFSPQSPSRNFAALRIYLQFGAAVSFFSFDSLSDQVPVSYARSWEYALHSPWSIQKHSSIIHMPDFIRFLVLPPVPNLTCLLLYPVTRIEDRTSSTQFVLTYGAYLPQV